MPYHKPQGPAQRRGYSKQPWSGKNSRFEQKQHDHDSRQTNEGKARTLGLSKEDLEVIKQIFNDMQEEKNKKADIFLVKVNQKVKKVNQPL